VLVEFHTDSYIQAAGSVAGPAGGAS